MKIQDNTGKELMNVSAIGRDGNNLVVKGKIFGTMPMTAKLTPEEARSAFRLLDFRLILFLLTFLFRRSTTPDGARK
jgi:hypothetical protein